MQFSTAQVKIVSMRSEKPICSLPRFSEVSPALPLKQFQFQSSSDWRWPFLILWKKSVERFLFPRLSPPGDRWCDALRCVLLNTSDLPRRKPLVMAACPASLPCLLGHFPSIRRVQSSTPTGDFEGGCRTLTHASMGFPFHFRPFVASSCGKRWLSTQNSLISSFMTCQFVTWERCLRWNVAHILRCLIN